MNWFVVENLHKLENMCMYLFKKGYPIDRMSCDCAKYERKHYAYYYEWALDYRPNKEK